MAGSPTSPGFDSRFEFPQETAEPAEPLGRGSCGPRCCRCKRFCLRSLAIFGFALAGLGMAWWQYGWRSPAYYFPTHEVPLAAPILTSTQYEARSDHARPYIYEIASSDAGAVLFFGSEHTKDPADPQIARIREAWSKFRPDVGLLESRLGFAIGGLETGVSEFGEPAVVYWLADADDVECYTWESPAETEVQRLLKQFTPQETAAFVILRPYFANYRHGAPDDPESYVEEYRAKRTRLPGLEGTFANMAELNAWWTKQFPEGPKWQETSDQYGLPGYLAQIAEASNHARDAHLARCILELTGQGKRVFVIGGSGHAVKLEGALRATLAPTSNTASQPNAQPPADSGAPVRAPEASGG